MEQRLFHQLYCATAATCRQGGRTACHRQSAGRHGRWNNEEAARVCAQLVDEIAATKEDVQQEGVTAALGNAAVAMASLSPSLALCGEEQQREASANCVCEQTKGSSSSSLGVHSFLPLGFQGLGF